MTVTARRAAVLHGCLVGLALALYALCCSTLLPDALRRSGADLLQAAVALGSGVVVARRSRTAEAGTRRAWRCAAGASLAWGAGQLELSLERLATGTVLRPGLCDVGFLLAVVLAVRGALTFPTVAASSVGRWRALLDGATVASSALLMTWLLVLSGTGTAPGLDLRLAYPLLDALIATVLVSAAVRLPRRHVRPLTLALAGLLLLTLTNLATFALARAGVVRVPEPLEAGFLLGFGLMALGALLEGSAATGASTERHRLQQLFPYLVVPPVLVVVGTHRAQLSAGSWLLTLAVLALYLLRQVLVVSENSDLAAQLLERSRHNEELVALLSRETLTDELTGLGNRRRLLEDARAASGPVALLYIDLDQFKRINDSLGHAAGDALLRETARRLTACTGPDDLVVRLGGDEFAVVLPGADEAGAVAVGERVLAMLSEPVAVDGTQVWSAASIGVALSTGLGHGTDAVVATLMRNADTAMYEAKTDGRGRVRAYRSSMHDAVSDRLALERDLRGALEDGSLEVHYQPVVRLSDGACVGAEALARWHHPERGAVPPDVFVPLAEETGLVRQLGEQVLREALRTAARWERDLGRPLVMAVNVSPKQLVDGDLCALVAACLAEAGLPPERLLLEVTERSLLAGERASSQLRALHALGVRLALDDFGTGWSSIAHLHAHPVDVIKLDRSYVSAMHEDPKAGRLVLGLLDLARSFELQVIAEGVETPEQAAALRAAGCQDAQGYHFSRPLPEGVFRDHVLRHGALSAVALGPTPSSPAAC